MLHDVVSVVHNLVHSLLSGMTGVVVDLIHIIPGYVEARVCIDHEPYRKQCTLTINTTGETAVVTMVIINMAL